MTSEPSTTTKVTNYTNTTRDNFLEWKRTIDAYLATHSDKLLTVVQEAKLSKAIELKLRMQCKNLEIAWDTATETAS